MAVNNAYAQYNNNKVLTASPAELTLLLYEGAIKFCNIAMMGLEENNIQKRHRQDRICTCKGQTRSCGGFQGERKLG